MNPTPSLDPKKEAGAKKTPLHLLPPYALAQTALAHAEGARRYGPWNWRTNQVCATTYIGAILRHLTAWQDGEDIDADSGLSHIAKIGACCNILLDAGHCGTLVDDRSKVPTKTNPNYTDAPFSEIRGFLKDGKFTVVQIGGPDSGFEHHGTPSEPASGWGKVMAEIEATVENAPTPPPGYRMLEEGEHINDGDLYLTTEGTWKPSACSGEVLDPTPLSPTRAFVHRPHARKIEAVK